MRLLFGIKSLSTISGGAERVLSDISSELSRLGHEVIIITFDNPNDDFFYPLNNKIKIQKIAIGNVKQKTTIPDFIKRVIYLRKAVKNNNPDVVIGFMSSMYILLSFALIATKYPLISSEHTVPEYYKKRKIEFLLLIFSGLLSKKITILSNKIGQQYPKILHNKMVVIPNSVSFKRIKGVTPSKKLILTVGRLVSSKDHETLIKSFAQIHKNYSDWQLRIVGDGKLKYKLIKLVESYQIMDKVFIVGRINNIEEEYSKASFFVLPSKYESFGLVTIEAMAFELPVIGFRDCDGTNELVVDRYNGLLVSGDNRVESLANGMELLMSDQFLLDSLKANTLDTAKNFSIDNALIKWEHMFNLVIKEK